MTKYIAKYRSLPAQVKASFWFLLCSFLQKGISSITTPIFTRLLDTAEYGRFSVFNSWLGIVTIFVSLNLCAGVYTQGLIKFDKERNIFSSSLQGLTLILIAGWTVVYLLSRDFWNAIFSLTTVQMLAMLVMIWASAAFNFWAAEQRVKLSYVKLMIVTLLVSLAKPVLGIVLVLNAEDKVTARILGLALVEVIGYSGLFVAQMARGKKFFSARYWKYAVLFNLPLIPHYLSQTVLSSSDRIMISRMVGESEAGIYNLAYSVSMIMTLFSTALGHTISPWVYQKIKNGAVKEIAPIVYIAITIIAGVNMVLVVFAPEIISLFAPKSYYEAIWVVPPVVMSVYFIFLYDRFAAFEFYYEKTKFIMVASSAAAIFNVLLNYLLIRPFGYIAAGYTTLFCYVAYDIGHYIFMRKICRERIGKEDIYDLKILLIITGIFVVAGFLCLLMYHTTILRYFLFAIFCVTVFMRRKTIISLIEKWIGATKNKTF